VEAPTVHHVRRGQRALRRGLVRECHEAEAARGAFGPPHNVCDQHISEGLPVAPELLGVHVADATHKVLALTLLEPGSDATCLIQLNLL